MNDNHKIFQKQNLEKYRFPGYDPNQNTTSKSPATERKEIDHPCRFVTGLMVL